MALASGAQAAIPEGYAERVADAIWLAEGGKKAKVPYGVLSVPTRSEAHAKAICLNTVRNSWGRWEKAGSPGDFIEFLGKRYCPVEGDKTGLNKHWIKNVRFFLRNF